MLVPLENRESYWRAFRSAALELCACLRERGSRDCEKGYLDALPIFEAAKKPPVTEWFPGIWLPCLSLAEAFSPATRALGYEPDLDDVTDFIEEQEAADPALVANRPEAL